MKQQLSEAEQDLADTKRDHANDMQSQGYDKLSEDLKTSLDDTEYEISHNADKQLEIINSMLDKAVSSYQEAYGKINSIIKNTGWVGSTDFNNTQSDLSTETGVKNQNSNASQSQSSANKNPSSTASGTKTDPINSNSKANSDLADQLVKPEDTTNRKVAELKVSPTSTTLEEGKSTSITATIRPNDAANKTLAWKSSNESIATVSNGTVKAKKPGSCTITATTTDGSGLSAKVSIKVNAKPKPPKPQPKPQPAKTGGDGIPRVGDVVTFTGSYYNDSWGMAPKVVDFLVSLVLLLLILIQLGNMAEMDVLLVILRSISRVRMILIIVILDGYVLVRLVVMKRVRIVFMAISLYGQTKIKTPNIMAFQN